MIFSNLILGSSLSLPAHGRVGARVTSFFAAHFAKRNTKFGGGESEGGQKFLPPNPLLFFARAFSLAREARRQFRSKKVRISSNKRTSIKLSGILPTDSAARSAAENGNTGSLRTARLAKRRFEIPCDFKYLLCLKKNFCYNKLAPTNYDCLF